MTLVVNLFGGPGCGKSTTAAGVFHELKKLDINCELVTEFAKDKAWEKNKKVFEAQIYLLGEQYWRLYRCVGEVDVIITDSPILLSAVYNDFYCGLQHLNPAVYELFAKFNNMNFRIKRSKPYNQSGRNESASCAIEIDHRVDRCLKENNIDFIALDCSNAVDTITRIVSASIGL